LLTAKYRLGLVKKRFVDPAKDNLIVEKPENVAEANRATERSITLLRNNDGFFPLSTEKAAKTLFVVVAADEDGEEGRTLIPEIQRREPKAKIVRLDPRSTPAEYDKVLGDAAAYDRVFIAPFVKRAALKGTVALPENQANFVKQMLALNKPVAVAAFGSPYLIRQFPEVKNYAAAYAIEEVAQAAFVKVMFGEAPFTGKLPVGVPGLFEIGTGIAR
jgi:beta-N-acetylhexosaminidase